MMNKDETLISVVLPFYNSEKFLEECIRSILSQSYRKIEVIAINDGSRDGSLDIIKKCKLLDNRIKIIDRENKGAYYSRIEGAKKAVGRYVLFVDADDVLLPNAITRIARYANGINDVVRANLGLLRANGDIEKKEVFRKKEFIELENAKTYADFYKTVFTASSYNSMQRCLYRKTLFDDINPKVRIDMGEDFLTNIQLFSKCKRICLIKDVIYGYRENEESITRTKNIDKRYSNLEDICKVYESIEKIAFQNDKKIKKYMYARFLKESNYYLRRILAVEKNNESIKELLENYYNKEIVKSARNNTTPIDFLRYKAFLQLIFLWAGNIKGYLHLAKMA